LSSYATLTDLVTYGLPATALANVPTATQTANINDASDVVDTYLRGRYSLPLIAWGTEITQAVCKIAAYQILSVRGYNPASQADVNIRDRYLDTISWLGQVQRQAAHPNVTPQPNQTPNYNQPFVISSSVIDVATGATAPNRRW
jgi:phage gp36-like protein